MEQQLPALPIGSTVTGFSVAAIVAGTVVVKEVMR